MKSSVIAALLGSASAVQIHNMQSTSSKMAKMCKDHNSYDCTLLQLADNDLGTEKFNNNIKETAQAHFGKTKAAIDAENKHILETQQTCLDFVNQHRDHPNVCNWCHKNSQPSAEQWQWNPAEGVWYKWSGDRYHYWGPSKEGLKHEWSWYQGYWHHKGYVYKYENGQWSRFQGGEWVVYHEKIDIDPTPPYGQECREFLKVETAHIPDSLTEHDIPRCQVGEGSQKTVYEFTTDADCSFVGGTKVFQKNFKCADGTGPQFRTVEVCVRGDKLAHEGLDYNTGQAYAGEGAAGESSTETHKTVHTSEGSSSSSSSSSSHTTQHQVDQSVVRTTHKCIGDLCVSKCYKFSMFDHTGDYLTNKDGSMAVASSVGGVETIWMVKDPLSETQHGISLARPNNMFMTAAEGGLTVAAVDGNTDAATFQVINGIAGNGGVSFQSFANTNNFIMHESYDAAKSEHLMVVGGMTSQEDLKRATFNIEEADCGLVAAQE